MKVLYYGIYDTKAKEFINIFTAKNDDVAERSAHYIVKDRNFDPIAGKDYCIQHVFDMETSNGAIVNNDVRLICNLASYMDEFNTGHDDEGGEQIDG